MPNYYRFNNKLDNIPDEISINLTERFNKRVEDSLDENEDNPLYVNVLKSSLKKTAKQNILERTFDKQEPTHILSAKMTKAGYINLTEGRHASELFSKQHIPDFTIDQALSTEHGLVFVNKKTNEIRVAYRGTQNLADWETNIKQATGLEERSGTIKSIDNQIKKIKLKYGKLPDLLSGHSKGGGSSIITGEKFGIPTHTQDPAIPATLIKKLIKGTSTTSHTIVRTPTDWVSSQAPLVQALGNNVEVISIRPDKGLGLLESHNLNVKTGIDYKSRGTTKFNNELKDKAFINERINAKQNLNDIAEELGYDKNSDMYKELERQYTEVASTPAHEREIISKEAGYSVEPRTGLVSSARRVALRTALNTTERITGAVGQAVSNVGQLKNTAKSAGIGLLVSYGLHEAGLEPMGIESQEIQGALLSFESGSISETALASVITKHINPSLLRTAFARGGGQALFGFAAGEVADAGITTFLDSVGIDETVSEDIGGLIGGGVSGGAFVAAPALGSLAYNASLQTAIRGGTALGVENIASVLGRIGLSSIRGATGGVAGIIGGTVLGLGIAGSELLYNQLNPPPPTIELALKPNENNGNLAIDTIIGTDPQVVSILTNFNNTAKYDTDSVNVLQLMVQNRVNEMNLWGGEYDYRVNFEVQPYNTSITSTGEKNYMTGNFDYKTTTRAIAQRENLSRNDELDRIRQKQGFDLPPLSNDYVLNIIRQDEKVKAALEAGDAYTANKHIRQIYIDRAETDHHFGEVIEYKDTTMPQITNKGEIVYHNMDSTPPAEQLKIEE